MSGYRVGLCVWLESADLYPELPDTEQIKALEKFAQSISVDIFHVKLEATNAVAYRIHEPGVSPNGGRG